MKAKDITYALVVATIILVGALILFGINDVSEVAAPPETEIESENTDAVEAEQMELVFYFPHEDDDLFLLEESVTRSIDRTITPADVALRILLAGPNEAERAEGYYSPFDEHMRTNGTDEPLRTFYNGITITDGVATIDFDEEALDYLNGPAAHQLLIKGSIQKTLEQFDTISSVEYSIDGEVYTMWDA